MARRALLLATGWLVLAQGCASSPSRFYTIRSTAPAAGATVASYAVAVGPVSVPAAVDRPEMVVHVAQNQVALLEFDRWAAPLGDAIAGAVAGDLASLLGTPRVATAPLANFVADYRVTIDVQRFDATPGDSVHIDAVWVVKPAAGSAPRSGRTVAREPAAGPGYDAIAAAYSRALARLSEDLAQAIRAAAADGGRASYSPSASR